ncbi:helix-turn-helix domain-containing protein [Actinoallomurus rhizosphaericola]|uniref:helix-turn-helix domain-containing protein n=1 Tax=Actinoallomurus rhizosphaericola TaxID=2952536 RepID=UPI002093ACD0|nr:helix-turn-helix domain-containing protein [Actinoallomurus rhizosphaericola]MCO6000141.1 helix-turn-helix domain-containing protein [Actinoallomurus rhizosphaericola]
MSSPSTRRPIASISCWTVYNLIRSNQLRSVKIGRRRLVPAAALTEYLDGLLEVAA